MRIMWAAVLCASLSACAEEDVPSCQHAIGHFYGTGCYFADGTKNPPVPYTEFESVADCKRINAGVSDNCRGEFEDYLVCLDRVPEGGTNAVCSSCTEQQDALGRCK